MSDKSAGNLRGAVCSRRGTMLDVGAARGRERAEGRATRSSRRCGQCSIRRPWRTTSACLRGKHGPVAFMRAIEYASNRAYGAPSARIELTGELHGTGIVEGRRRWTRLSG